MKRRDTLRNTLKQIQKGGLPTLRTTRSQRKATVTTTAKAQQTPPPPVPASPAPASASAPAPAPAPASVTTSALKKPQSKDAWEHELSGKIQWLMNIAGAENIMEAIGEHFGNKHITVLEGKVLKPDGAFSNTLYFKTKFPKPSATEEQLKYRGGHWLFYDKKGKLWNSYELGHQVKNTNQFCQTFALMYMVSNNWTKKKHYPKWVTLLKKYDYGPNICVAVEFWRYIFHYQPLTKWLIDVVKANNDVTIEYNKDESDINQETLISDTTDAIDLQLIDEKLDDICKYADEIAINTN